MNKLYTFLSRRLWWLALSSLVVIALSQLFGRMIWQLELFSHYVPHLAILLLLGAIFYPKVAIQASTKTLLFRPLRALFLLYGLGFMVWSLQPLSWIANQTTTEKSATKPTTIYYQNVNINNDQAQVLVNRLIPISKEIIIDADIIALVEASGSNWSVPHAMLTDYYPLHCGMNEASPFAIQIYAKDTHVNCEILMVEGVALARLTLADNRMLYVAHPPPPINGQLAQARNNYLHALARLIKEDTTHKVMVVGDFNLSAFSPIYRDFIKNSTTVNNELVRTTMTGLPTWLPFGIGIDHVLTTDNAKNVQTQALGWHGSDHRGFLIEWASN